MSTYSDVFVLHRPPPGVVCQSRKLGDSVWYSNLCTPDALGLTFVSGSNRMKNKRWFTGGDDTSGDENSMKHMVEWVDHA
jgi:hypothetical protein